MISKKDLLAHIVLIWKPYELNKKDKNKRKQKNTIKQNKTIPIERYFRANHKSKSQNLSNIKLRHRSV